MTTTTTTVTLFTTILLYYDYYDNYNYNTTIILVCYKIFMINVIYELYYHYTRIYY